MKVKALFNLLDNHNELNRLLGRHDNYFRVYFDDYCGEDFRNFRQFFMYVNREYVDAYCLLVFNTEVLTNTEDETTENGFIIEFDLDGRHHKVELYLR